MTQKIIIPTVERAIELGKDAAAIESAIAQLKIAMSNDGGITVRGSRVETYGFPAHSLFEALSERRQAIRAELLGKEY